MRTRIQSFIACSIAALCISTTHADIGNKKATLLAEDGATLARLGSSVAISGSTAVVGAVSRKDNGEMSGAAYLFDISSQKQIFKLLPDDGRAFHRFGAAVAISGSTAIVSASGGGEQRGGPGSIYLFDTTTGQQFGKLLPDNTQKQNGYGISIGISGDTIIAGEMGKIENGASTGVVHVYNAKQGTKIHTLRPSNGDGRDSFGESVAIDADSIIVGARRTTINGSVSGAAYVFDTTTGKQLFRLLPDDISDNYHFGSSVAISGTTAVIGAMYDDANGRNSGSAYLFDTTTGKQLFKLLPANGNPSAVFGSSVAISGNIAIIGSYGDDEIGAFTGAAYLFDTNSGEQIAKVMQHDFTTMVMFGTAVGIDGDTAIVGSPGSHDQAPASGSVFLFDVSEESR